MTRVIRYPAVSFEMWSKINGIALPPEHLLAECVGATMLANKTRMQKGKWKANLKRLAAHQEALARYQAAVASGEISIVVEEVPLDMTNAADQAYARVLAKRAARSTAMRT